MDIYLQLLTNRFLDPGRLNYAYLFGVPLAGTSHNPENYRKLVPRNWEN